MKYKIKDLMDVYRGASPRPIIEYLTDKGYRWLKISDFKMYDRYVYDTKEYIKETGVKKTRFIRKGTLILTNSATPGIPIFLGNDMCLHDGFLYFQNINERIINIKFLYYWFLFNKNKILNQANGSVFQNLKKEIVENFEIDLPVIENQIKIATLLEKINDKIELNNKINDNLYKIQKSYFKELFNDLNYQEISLNEICDINAGGDAPKEKSEYKNENFNIPIISNGIDNEGIYGYTKEAKIKTKSITISARGTIGYKVLRNYHYYPIVRLISIIPKDKKISTEYLYYALDNVQINGTGTTQQQLTVPMVKQIKVKIYDFELMEKFTNFAVSINKKIEKNRIENEILSNLRGTLLPKLMNGDIDLDKIEI